MATNAAASGAMVASLFHGGRIRIRTHLVFTRASSSSTSVPCSFSCPPPLLLKSHGASRIPLCAKIELWIFSPRVCFVHWGFLCAAFYQSALPIRSANCSSPVAPSSAAAADVDSPPPPASLILTRKSVIWVLLLAPFCFLLLCWACGSGHAAASTAPTAASDSIRASGTGLKIAAALRRSGWADEAIVFALATLPVLELRGAIPVGYWMQLDPLRLTVLSIIGNMVPVPFIVLYLQRLASFLSQMSEAATRFLNHLFDKAREKAGPVEEFQWLGLMLFVAVPFPGTGAWTGAFIASILGMPFWFAISANLFGVILAGLLVNLLVNLGLKYAVAVGAVLFFVSTVMWSVLRHLKKSMNSK